MDLKRYNSIVAKTTAPLFKYCYYRLDHNKELTEETLNDIFCVLYKKWNTLDLDDNLMGWLYHVADLEIMQHKRKYNIYYAHNAPLDDDIKQRLNCIGYSDEYFVSDETNDEQYLRQIEASLSEEYRLLFRYRFIEKHTLTETADHIGIPYSTLRLRLKKLEKQVRVKIKEIFESV